MIRGRLELTLGHDHTSAAPGCWVHLPAKLPHAVRATEPSIMLLTMLPDPGQPAPDAGPDQ